MVVQHLVQTDLFFMRPMFGGICDKIIEIKVVSMEHCDDLKKNCINTFLEIFHYFILKSYSWGCVIECLKLKVSLFNIIIITIPKRMMFRKTICKKYLVVSVKDLMVFNLCGVWYVKRVHGTLSTSLLWGSTELSISWTIWKAPLLIYSKRIKKRDKLKATCVSL